MLDATAEKPQGVNITETSSDKSLSPQDAKETIRQILRKINWTPFVDFGEVNIYIKNGKADHLGVRYTDLV